MKTTYFHRLLKLLVLTALLLENDSFSQSKYQSQLNIIFDTFITKDFKLLHPILKFREKKHLSGTEGIDLEIISQQICLVSSPESYRIVGSEAIGDDERMTVEYQYHDKLRLYYFIFNPKGKLIGFEAIPRPSL